MATTDLYTNEMMAAMIAKLTDTVTALNNVNAAVAQSVASLNIKPAGVVNLPLVHAAKVVPSFGVWTEFLRLNSVALGKFNVSVPIKAASTGDSFRFKYSNDNGATFVDPGTIFMKGTTAVFPVGVTDMTKPLIIQVYNGGGGAGSSISVDADTIGLAYAIKDIVNEGPFSIV